MIAACVGEWIQRRRRAMKHIMQGGAPARPEGRLVGAGRNDAFLRLVKKVNVLAAGTVGQIS